MKYEFVLRGIAYSLKVLYFYILIPLTLLFIINWAFVNQINVNGHYASTNQDLSQNISEKTQLDLQTNKISVLKTVQSFSFDLATTLKSKIDINQFVNVNNENIIASRIKFENYKKDDLTLYQKQKYKKLISELILKFPEDVRKNLNTITLRNKDDGARGLAGYNSLFLIVGSSITDSEISSVAVHELGHIYDLAVWKGDTNSGESEFKDGTKKIYKSDLSVNFYRISWKDSLTLRDDTISQDFITGYAKTDPFEDFAETFIYYVLHGNEFRYLKDYNTNLALKYSYIKDNIFKGEEFSFDDNFIHDIDTFSNYREWDATLIPYDYNLFMASSL